MQQLTSTVLVALGGALVVLGGYHALVVAPQMRRLAGVLDAHDSLLGGGSAKATDRIASLEAASAADVRTQAETQARIATLESIAQSEVPRIGFVRYNAFTDTGSDLSYALALLNKKGDGVVISSIWSREETRTYGKAVTNFNSAQDASSEELAAIAKARAAAS
ncbi:MAG: hypothetical protein NVSMB64_09550 [Candidatus Velthaea sp.]